MRNPYVFSQLVDLLNKTNFQDVKDQSISGELLLFYIINTSVAINYRVILIKN